MSDWKKYERKQYSDFQIGYIAGVMDSDGCFFIGNFSRSKHTGSEFYQTVLTVANTEESMIDRLVRDFGGLKGKYTPKQTPKNSRRPVYRWTATGERLEHLCEIMLEHLSAKRNQCEIMLKMRETYKRPAYKKGHQGALRISQDILDLRKKLFDDLRALHVRNYLNKNTV